MVAYWFTAIYEGVLLEFKFHPQNTKSFNPKCWITTRTGKDMFVDMDLMTFGEYEHLQRRLNEKTVS